MLVEDHLLASLPIPLRKQWETAVQQLGTHRSSLKPEPGPTGRVAPTQKQRPLLDLLEKCVSSAKTIERTPPKFLATNFPFKFPPIAPGVGLSKHITGGYQLGVALSNFWPGHVGDGSQGCSRLKWERGQS